MHAGNGQRGFSEVTGKGPGPGLHVVGTALQGTSFSRSGAPSPSPTARPSWEKVPPLRGSRNTPSPSSSSSVSYYLPLLLVNGLSGVHPPAGPPVPLEQRLYLCPRSPQCPVGPALSLCSVTGKGRRGQDPLEDESCVSQFTPKTSPGYQEARIHTRRVKVY